MVTHYDTDYKATVALAEQTGDWSRVSPGRDDQWTVAKGKYKGRVLHVDKRFYSGMVSGQLAPTDTERRWKEVTISSTSLGVRTVDGGVVRAEKEAQAKRERHLRHLGYIAARVKLHRDALTHLRGKVAVLVDGDPVASAARLRAVAAIICTHAERPRHGNPPPAWFNRATLYRLAYQLDGDGSVLYNTHGETYSRSRKPPKQGA